VLIVVRLRAARAHGAQAGLDLVEVQGAHERITDDTGRTRCAAPSSSWPAITPPLHCLAAAARFTANGCPASSTGRHTSARGD